MKPSTLAPGIAAAVVLLAANPPAGAQHQAATTTVVDSPRAAIDSPRRNKHYVSTRQPLAPAALVKLPIGAIIPRGWLRTQLVLMRNGMTGHLEDISPWCDATVSAWMTPDGTGKNGWEELPYWLRGAGDLAWVLKDSELGDRARKWIDGVLASQDDSGYFGPRENKTKLDLWPNMVVLNVLQSFYEATGDARVLPFMSRYFQWEYSVPKDKLLPGSWQKIRAGDNIESVLWLYNRTGEAWLLGLARVLHERTVRWDKGVADWHGVNICQGFREPAVYSLLTRDPAHLARAEENYQDVMHRYGQAPGGMFGADEVCREGYGDPRQAAETCSMVEFMHSFEMLTAITGDGVWADRCEEVAFNSLPAAFTPDYSALHYLTAPNMPRADSGSHAPGFFNGGNMLGFDPADHRCCQHNHAMGWPYYAENLWMATPDDGLGAVLYSDSDVRATVGDPGTEVIVHENTGYPFDETVTLTFETSQAGTPVKFPLYLRLPRWCDGAGAQLNDRPLAIAAGPIRPGSWLRILRAWSSNDTLMLTLPMHTAVTTWTENKNAVSVGRGPLWYSLKIGERSQRYGGTNRWPAWEVLPTTPWNYALVLDGADPASSFEFVRRPGPPADQPFTTDNAPVQLLATARRIPNWQLDHTGLVGLLQSSPVRSSEPDERVTLIPMGAARLRISAFPVVSDAPDAHDWILPPPPRHDASQINDDLDAVSDGRFPTASADESVPRFTWWDHKGTTEWISWRLDAPAEISTCAVYWFDDTGRGQCRVPASWRLFFKDGDVWREVENGSAYGVAPDALNRVMFKPVRTTSLKLEARLRDGFSGGILEWQINDGR